MKVSLKLKIEKFVNVNVFYMFLSKLHDNGTMNSQLNLKIMVFINHCMITAYSY